MRKDYNAVLPSDTHTKRHLSHNVKAELDNMKEMWCKSSHEINAFPLSSLLLILDDLSRAKYGHQMAATNDPPKKDR